MLQRLIGISIILIFSVSFVCSAATVHGVVYCWEDLKPLPKAVIVVNTTPIQRFVTPNGSYSFNLPPGCYVIKAYYYKEGKLDLYAEYNITIKNASGNYIVDLILFPPLNFNFSQPEVEFPASSTQNPFPVTVIISVSLVGLTVFILYVIWRIKIKNKENEKSGDHALNEWKENEISYEGNVDDRIEYKNTESSESLDLSILPDDLKEVLEEIVKAGGRITQKELRKKLRYSEAKVSLMLTDLERRGCIEKVKKGRGNVIFLKDEYRKFFRL
jgi:uncharacterized membrane protein